MWFRAMSNNQRIAIPDPCFTADGTYFINSATFQSGLLSTTPQHTILYILVVECAIDEMKRRHGSQLTITIDHNQFGDDGMTICTGDLKNKIVTDLANEFFDVRDDLLSSLGYEVQRSVSSITCNFLQQSAFAGVYFPLSHRLSVFTSETTELNARQNVAKAEVMFNYIREASQRTSTNANSRSFLTAVWNVLRFDTYRTTNENSIHTHPPYITTVRKPEFVEIHVLRPFLLMHFKPYYLPMPPYISKYASITGSSMASPYSDVVWILFRPLITTPGFENTLTKPYDRIDRQYMYDLGITTLEILAAISADTKMHAKRKEEAAPLFEPTLAFYIREQDYYKRQRSFTASNTLRERNIKLPGEFAYTAAPEQKTKQAFLAKRTSRSEKEFAMYVQGQRFEKPIPVDLPQYVKLIINTLALTVLEGSHLNDHPDFVTMGDLRPLPSYHKLDPFGLTFRRYGSIMHESSVFAGENKGIVEKLEKMGLERVVDYVRRADNAGKRTPEIRTIIGDYLGISSNQRTALFKFIDLVPVSPLINYTSYFNNAAHFDINTTRSMNRENIDFTALYVGGETKPCIKLQQFVNLYTVQIDDLVRSSVDVLTTTLCKKMGFVLDYSSYRQWERDKFNKAFRTPTR